MIAAKKGSRKGTLYLIRRRPKRYEAVESRNLIWVNLNTDSMGVAKTKAEIAWQELVEAWEAKLAGADEDADKHFEAARRLAASRSLRYLKAEDVSQLPLRERLDRMQMVGGSRDDPDAVEARAFLGGAREPTITISKALELYWDLAREKTLGMSPDQLRRWRNPRIKAIKNLIRVIGDKAISEISGDDMLDWRQFWLDRIENEDLTPGSANKDLVHLGDVLKTVNRLKRLGLVLPLTDLAFKTGVKATRHPFSDDWIRDRLLAPGALDGLNVEARNIVKVMVNTGMRLSEVANLRPEHIHLDGEVPYVEVAPTKDRRLKTRNAQRQIPLTGVSLQAMRECPGGFPRYHDKPGLSATINSFLRENGLVETPQHTIYGLRHSFEDRLLAANVDERIRRDLMGHALNRERYGRGGSLKQVQEILQRVAL